MFSREPQDIELFHGRLDGPKVRIFLAALVPVATIDEVFVCGPGEMIDTVAQTATISVDGKKYATTVGTPFGQYYMMYSVFNDTCVGVLAGDSSIAVCTTKPVTVTP